MTDGASNEQDRVADARRRLIDAALPHVTFDGWSRRTLDAATADSGVDPSLARLAFPRGGIDMALAFHRLKDDEMSRELSDADLDAMRIRDRVTFCVRRRIELVSDEREAVRRGAALFALPHHAPEGARAIWETANIIWTLCGDVSTDYNWYTKRAILSGVYTSTVLYWLGDEEPGAPATWAFLDRRIEDVMRFEKGKAAIRDNQFAKAALAIPGAFASLLKAPGAR